MKTQNLKKRRVILFKTENKRIKQEKHGLEIILKRVLSGCPYVVQKTYSLGRSGSVRDSKQRNKRFMIVFNGNIGTM